MARAFLFGALAVIPAIFLEYRLAGNTQHPSLWECFFVIGPVEEICKCTAAVLAVGRERDFDEPADGIVYAAAAALGFAFAENLWYFASMNTHTYIVRTGLSVPSHVLAAIPWAVALGKIKCDEFTPKRLLVTGLIIASLLHGMYDALCYQIRYPHDIALIALLALTLLEWRLYLLSMSECLKLGKRLWRRRMFSTATKDGKHKTIYPMPFNWRWFFLPLIMGIAISTAGFIGVSHLVAETSPLYPLRIDMVVVSVLMLVLGIAVAFLSPGRTVRESAIALAISGFSLSFVIGWPSKDPLECGVYFSLLGAFGSWLGEMLQDAAKRAHHAPVPKDDSHNNGSHNDHNQNQ